MLSDLISTVFSGLTWAMGTFLVASGLTLIFGILHILNFAQGAFFAIGAFMAASMIARLGGSVSLAAYLGVSVAAAIGVAILGLITDVLVFRRLRGVPESYVLIATYALLLVAMGLTKLVWGLDPVSVAPPTELMGAISIGDAILPTYSLFVIASGIVVYVGLEVLIRGTRFGHLAQAVGLDAWEARLLGIDVSLIYSVSLMIGIGLAGLAGGLLAANQSLTSDMGDTFIIQAFGAIIVGGIGSIGGAFVASILLGLIEAFGDTYIPQYPGIFFFIGLGLILLLRPSGLAGRERLA
jgi:branched-chain amino acid transport system permease protein